jgi:hypothetical protein
MELAREKVGLWIEMLRKFSRSPDSLGAFRYVRFSAQNALDNYGLHGIGGSGRYKNYRRATFRVTPSM